MANKIPPWEYNSNKREQWCRHFLRGTCTSPKGECRFVHPSKAEVLGACAEQMEASRKAFKDEKNWKKDICRYSGKNQTCFEMENKGYCRYIHPDIDGDDSAGKNNHGWEDDENEVAPKDEPEDDPPKGKGTWKPKPPPKGKGKTKLSGKKRNYDETLDPVDSFINQMKHMSSYGLGTINDATRLELDRRNEGRSSSSKYQLWTSKG